MHYHLEIIMPPVDNVENAVEEILIGFKEGGEDEDGNPNSHAFWDFFIIGGRWSGDKLLQSLNKKKLDEFYGMLKTEKITVSGITCGKQSIEPTNQIPKVDELWKKCFPKSEFKACPIFSHFNDQYKHSEGFPDILTIKDTPKNLTASHVIIAGPDYEEKKVEAKYMTQDSMWNGVSHVDTKWDGKVFTAIKMHKKQLENMNPNYAKKQQILPNWLSVTIDYHS